MAQLAWKRLGLTMVLVHGESPPSDLEWSEYLHAIDPRLQRDGCSIVFTEGAAPTAEQRKLIQKRTHDAPFPTAVLTSRALVRVIISGIALFNTGVRAFGPGDIGPALAFLKSPATEASVRAVRDELTVQLEASRR